LQTSQTIPHDSCDEGKSTNFGYCAYNFVAAGHNGLIWLLGW